MASVEKRANGRWRARWREWPGGPQRSKHFAKKSDAERFLVDVQHKLLMGAYVTPEAARVPFSAYADAWMARQPWRASTAALVSYSIERATETFGDRPLGSIRKGDVQSFVSGLALGPATVATIFQHVHSLLEAAAEDGVIVRNPARGVKLPAPTTGQVAPPTTEQVAVIYEAAVEWFRPAVVLGAGLGLRQGEALGLTADRVLWLERCVRVDRQWLTRRGQTQFGPPKTASSYRTIPASQWVLDELAAHVGRRHEGFVLHRDGVPLDHNAFDYRWRQAARRAGLVGMRYHHLRHAFASMLIAAGCSVRAVQHALGHTNAATTLNLYSHLWPGDEDWIRQAVDQALARGAEDSLRTGVTGE
jgi:integrase